jgi:glycosyltransferase involved in cell wall biosynthesis
MADAVDRLLGDPQLREWMGRAARERFLNTFEFEIVYEKINRMYERVSHGFDK